MADKEFRALESSLQGIGFYGGDIPPRDVVDKILRKAEPSIDNRASPQAHYLLGSVLQCYSSWYVRGDDCKSYLEKATHHLGLAFSKGLQSGVPVKSNSQYHQIDLVEIASSLARLYIDEKLVRNLESGERLCYYAWQNTTGYEPVFCSYAELFYKRGEYENCLNVALATHARGVVTQKKDGLPVAPAPMNIVGKALRALVRQEKKAGDISKAIAYGNRAVDLDVASENDKKILSRIKSKASGDNLGKKPD